MITETRREGFFILGFGVDDTSAFAARQAMISAKGLDGMFVRAHRKTHVVGQNAIIPRETQAAAPFAGASRVRDHFETLDARRKFRLDDLDRSGFAITQVKRCRRDAVFAGACAGAAAEYFIVHEDPVTPGIASAEH